MTVQVTMLQTRRGEGGVMWTVGNTYDASDAFAYVLINSNLATGTLPAVPQSDVLSLVSGGGINAPGGSDTQPQYNNAGAFNGMNGLSWNSATSKFTFGSTANVEINGAPVKIGLNNGLIDLNSNLGGVPEVTANTKLYISQTSGPGAVQIDQIYTGGNGAGLVLRRIQGTVAAPADVIDGQQIGYIDMRSYFTDTCWQQVSIAGHVDGLGTSGQPPGSEIRFFCNAVNGYSTEVMRMRKTGLFVNTTTGIAGSVGNKFAVAQDASSAEFAVGIKGGTTTGSSNGLRVVAGTNASDLNTSFIKSDGSVILGAMKGEGTFYAVRSIFNNAGAELSGFSSAKFVVVQTAGTADYTAAIKGSTTTGGSFGLRINAGTNASDFGFVVSNVGASTLLFTVRGDGAANASGALTSGGAFGCNGNTAQSKYTVNAASSDLSTVVALCNQLRAALIANGICV